MAEDRVEALFRQLDREAEAGGYHLNPDRELVMILLESLLTNTDRYGYRACPCRLASGAKEADLDIICPCDYRDPDLNDYGACYCALYVSEEIARGEKQAEPIPERRPPSEERQAPAVQGQPSGMPSALSHPVWRCRVCGYLCGRDEPPQTCPVCRAEKGRFERFM